MSLSLELNALQLQKLVRYLSYLDLGKLNVMQLYLDHPPCQEYM